MSRESVRELLLAELRRLPEDRRLLFLGEDAKRAKICCFNPDHKEGNESTPSCFINLDPDSPFPLGSYYCFGCTAKGPWSDLAIKYKLKGVNKRDLYADRAPTLITPELTNHLFGQEIALPPAAFPWPA